ncbi:Protein phosphatase 1L [Dirofilaria immitis]
MVLSTVSTFSSMSHFFWLFISRFEIIVLFAATGIILLYTRWMIGYCHLFIRGKNLESFTLINQNKYYPPKLVKFGLTDIPKYPGGNWRWKHQKWTFYASRGNRPYMEDRMHYLNDPHHNLVMFSIFDGHGGPFVSQYLEEHFSEAIRRRLLRRSSEYYPPSLTGHSNERFIEAIITEVHNIDDEILKLHPSMNLLTGSTLISVMLERNRFLTVINVGDSRAVACDITGTAIPLSTDHKPSNENERKRIENAGGFIEFSGVDRLQGILSVSRAFGDTALKRLSVLTAQPDIVRIDLNEINLKFILVASDGFWDVLTNEQAINIASTFLRISSNQWHKIFGTKSIKTWFRG